MSCVIKLPGKSKGVVSFTTQERDKLFSDPEILSRVVNLKSKWFIGLHHNWQPSECSPYFDFNMTGREDIHPYHPLIDMDACNFSPEYFYKVPKKDKLWDILYVTRSVDFKRIPAFLNSIRQLYDSGKKYRVLLICAVSPEKGSTDRSPENLIETYKQMFSHEERELFNLMEINYNYPFPLDLETIAVFYKNSKVFTHFANNERRCRVTAYAHACGMPLVSYAAQVTLIPPHLRKQPVCFTATSDTEMTAHLINAVEYFNKEEKYDDALVQVSNYFSNDQSKKMFKNKLCEFFHNRGEQFVDEGLNLENLDRRLGRHHSISFGANKVDMDFNIFLNHLDNFESLKPYTSSKDLEMELAKAYV